MTEKSPISINRSPRRKQTIFRCPKCKHGLMEPSAQDGEPEYSEIFSCAECGHEAVIPAITILLSQILTGICGGFFAIYLWLSQLAVFLTAFQFSTQVPSALNIVLLIIATLFVAGFVFVFVKGVKGISRRRMYLAN